MVKTPATGWKCSFESPCVKRASPPISQSITDQRPRSAALKPQPSAGVEYWSLETVVPLRPGCSTVAEVFEKSELRSQACRRQPRSSPLSGCASVMLAVTPSAEDCEPTRPELRFSP